MNSDKMLSLRHLHIYFLIHRQYCMVMCYTIMKILPVTFSITKDDSELLENMLLKNNGFAVGTLVD